MERGRCRLRYYAVAVVGKVDRSTHFGGLLLEDWTGFGIALPYHNGHAGFDDAGFLARDERQGVAEELRVVETYVGDDAEVGRDDIGAVETATHAHLDDSHINLLSGEIVEGKPHGHLEEAELEALHIVFMELNETGYLFLRYHGTIDADALTKIDEVRRGVEPHFVASLHEDGGQHVGHRAFAVGAGHVDGTEAALGVAEVLHEADGVGDVGLVGSLPDAVVHGQGVEEVVEGFGVGHKKTFK